MKIAFVAVNYNNCWITTNYVSNIKAIHGYVKVFYNRCALRPSCYMCPYATIERKTDMTIGDFWHIDEMIPDFYDENGNSLFLIHTDQGEKVFDDIKENVRGGMVFHLYVQVWTGWTEGAGSVVRHKRT